VSKILGRRLLRERGNAILFLCRQDFGTTLGYDHRSDPRAEWCASRTSFRFLSRYVLLRLREKAEGADLEAPPPEIAIRLHDVVPADLQIGGKIELGCFVDVVSDIESAISLTKRHDVERWESYPRRRQLRALTYAKTESLDRRCVRRRRDGEVDITKPVELYHS